ncbi:MAG: DUF4833 domain-containing protein [Cyclobacteriaceae bacterium]
MRFLFTILVISLLNCHPINSQNGSVSIKASYKFPTPPESEKSLFYLQRSQNSNTIQYDINLDSEGKIDEDDPVEVYWLRYNTTGEKRDLKWMERKMAYGVKTKRLSESAYQVKMVAYDERPILVHQKSNGEVIAKIKINGQMVKFKSIFIDMIEGGWIPTIKTIELFGEDLATGKPVYEKFKPKD